MLLSQLYFLKIFLYAKISLSENSVLVIAGQMQVKQLHDWLSDWNKKFLNTDQKGKGKKQNDSGAKKAVLLSGNPGIGKTTSAKLVSQMLGFRTIEVKLGDLSLVSISFRSFRSSVPSVMYFLVLSLVINNCIHFK